MFVDVMKTLLRYIEYIAELGSHLESGEVPCGHACGKKQGDCFSSVLDFVAKPLQPACSILLSIREVERLSSHSPPLHVSLLGCVLGLPDTLVHCTENFPGSQRCSQLHTRSSFQSLSCLILFLEGLAVFLLCFAFLAG